MAFDESTAHEVSSETVAQQYGHIGNRSSGFKALSLLDRAVKGTSDTEQRIANRPSAIASFPQAALNSIQKPGLAGPFGGLALNVLGAGGEAIESVPANIGLGIQQRKGVKQTFQDVTAGLTGKRPAQLGDIARASGLPGISNPIVASATGLLASSAPGLATSIGREGAAVGSRALTAPVRNISNTATFVSRRTMGQRLTTAVDAAVEAIGKKYGAKIDVLSAEHAAQSGAVPINIQPALTELADVVKAHPSIQGQLLKDAPLLSNALSAPQQATITLKDAQALKLELTKLEPVARVVKQEFAYGLARSLRKVRNLVRQAEVDAVPKLQEHFADYTTKMRAYDLVKPLIKPGRRGGQIFGQGKLLTDADTRLALKELLGELPKNPIGTAGRANVFQDVLGAARTAATGRTIGKGAQIAGRVAAYALPAWFLGKALTGRSNSSSGGQ